MALYSGRSTLFLDQTEARRAKKIFFGDRPPPYIRVWITPYPPLSQGVDPALLCTITYA